MFYKLENESLLSGDLITSPNFVLVAEDKDYYDYPVDGWTWFDTEEEAKAHFEVTNESSI
jgi:hypothetical protein